MKIIIYLIFLIFLTDIKLKSEEIKINDNTDKSAQRAPFITKDNSNNLYIAWIDFRNNRNGDIFFSKSTDNGNSWTKNKLVYDGPSLNTNFQRAVDLKIGPNGNMYFLWMEFHNDTSSVQFIKSTDGGITFSTAKSISFDNEEATQDFPSLAVDSSGNLHVAFVDARNQEKGEVNYHQIMYINSNDEGETWSKPKVISHTDGTGGSCECCATDICVSKDGKVLVAYRSNIDNYRDIYLARSEDFGETFQEPVRIGVKDWYIEACPVKGPVIQYYEPTKTAHLVYNTKSEIYYSRVDEDYLSNNKEVFIGKADYPAISMKKSGEIVIAYSKFSENNPIFTWRNSLNGGNSFNDEIDRGESFVPSEFPRMISIGDNVFITYQKYSSEDGTYNVYFDSMNNKSEVSIPSLPNEISSNDTIITTKNYIEWSNPMDCDSCNMTRYELQLSNENNLYNFKTYNNYIIIDTVDFDTYKMKFSAFNGVKNINKELIFIYKDITDVDNDFVETNILYTTDGELKINLEDNYRISLYNINGRKIKEIFGLGNQVFKINTNEKYLFLRVIYKGEVFSRKVIQ